MFRHIIRMCNVFNCISVSDMKLTHKVTHYTDIEKAINAAAMHVIENSLVSVELEMHTNRGLFCVNIDRDISEEKKAQIVAKTLEEYYKK